MTVLAVGSGAQPAPRTLGQITTKAQLIGALTDAAVLEHQFMCQYLYAAFSLKKSPDRTCTAAQFERVRRWAQQLYMIARQEMEHLSIVNTLLAALGGPPCFRHANFPTLARYYRTASLREHHGGAGGPGLDEPCEIPFLLDKFSLRTVRRFACMESPRLSFLPERDRNQVHAWGFHLPGTSCAAILPPTPIPGFAAENVAEVEVGTVQQLYQKIVLGLRLLEREIGSAALFTGDGGGQAEVPSEYQLFLFRIQDVPSAVAALNLVTQQGEGLDAPPGFESHFLNFFTMAEEYARLLETSPSFDPALALPLDPQFAELQDPDAQLATAIFNYGYVTLLLMLTGYYGLFRTSEFNKPGTYLTAALQYNSFAPLMTMFVRTMAELLVQLPARPAPGSPRAAPNFYLAPADLALLGEVPSRGNFYGSADFYAQRLRLLIEQIDRLRSSPTLPAGVGSRLLFMVQNLGRVLENFRSISVSGIYPPFNPNLPPCSGLPTATNPGEAKP